MLFVDGQTDTESDFIKSTHTRGVSTQSQRTSLCQLTSMSQAIMELFCIMAYMMSKKSPGDERIFRRSIDSDIPPVKSTRALHVWPPVPMLS